MTPILSIIIPTYKRKESLQRLLQSLSDQENVSAEIIVVDQNPSGFLDSLMEIFPSAQRLILEVPNASDARNKGFLVSKGNFILFIDDDLVPEPDFCESGIQVFNDYPSVESFSPLVYTIEGKDRILHQMADKRLHPLSENNTIFSITETISAALFFRRNYYERTGGFDPLLFEFAKTAEDHEFFLRMRRKKMNLYFVPFLSVFHDEGIPGGCELRTSGYWISRERCIKSWALRARIHQTPLGSLSLIDRLQLARSSFLNKEVLGSSLKEIRQQAGLLQKSIKESAEYLKIHPDYYHPVEDMDHLAVIQN